MNINLDMLEFKHVALNKSVLNLLIRPRDKQLVIVCCLHTASHNAQRHVIQNK